MAITKKKEREILRRYKPPKGASPEEIKRLRKNQQAALWRENNREKVRASQRAYAKKVKTVEERAIEQLEQYDAGNSPDTVIPITDGPELMYDALSYGRKVTGSINASWIEAKISGRKVVGLISDFDEQIKGPYLSLTGFLAAVQALYQEGIRRQAEGESIKVTTSKKAGKTIAKKGKVRSIYPVIDSSYSDDGATVIITVNAFMIEASKLR